MTDSRERYLQSDTARLWSCTAGRGVPLLMFNGGPGCDDYLGPVAAMLEDRCRVIRFEPRGCGRSDWDGQYSLQTLMRDADAVRTAHGAAACVVAGHSFGADAALAYALRHPHRVLGVIGIAGGRLVNDRTWHAAYRRGLEEVGEDYGDVTFTADPRVNPDCNRSWRTYIQRPALFRQTADLAIPATFIHGTRDIRPGWPARQLAALLPHGEYVEIEGAAHTIWLTHGPELQEVLHRAIHRIRNFASQDEP